MPFKYERKTNRCFRSPPDVSKRAAKCVTEEGMSYRKAAANFNVDKMTLMLYMKKKEKFEVKLGDYAIILVTGK